MGNKAIFIQEVSVTDPESEAPVSISIYKDKTSGGMFGVDSSFLETLEEDENVTEPFNGNKVVLVD